MNHVDLTNVGIDAASMVRYLYNGGLGLAKQYLRTHDDNKSSVLTLHLKTIIQPEGESNCLDGLWYAD